MRTKTHVGAWIMPVGIVAYGLLVTPAPGSDLTQSRVQSWVEAEIAAAPTPIPLENLCITYRMEWHDVPPPKELHSLRDAVARHPDHPDRRSLDVYERRLREGPSVERFRVWIGADGRWRRSNVPARSRPAKEPTDIAWTPEAAWIMGRDYLTITDPRKESSGAYNYGSLFEETERWLGFCVHGGLTLIDSLGLEPGDVQSEGDAWYVDASREGVGTIRFMVAWAEERAQGRVTAVRILRSPASPAEEGSAYMMSDWREEPVLSGILAHRVESRHADGRLQQIFVLESIEVGDGELIDRITAVPAFDAPDAIRGPVAFTRVQDRRSGTDQYTTIDRFGTDPAAPVVGTDAPRAPPADRSLDWRWVGWASAGAIACVLVLGRIRSGR